MIIQSVMNSKVLIRLSLLLFAGFILACSSGTNYERLVKKELASGVRQDSIFFGMHFGMDSKDFYARCWELNRMGLAREGAMNTTVRYDLKNGELPFLGAIEFYPIFKENKVASMTGNTSYVGWAPWNKRLWSDNLIDDTKLMFEKWYGEGFFPIKSPTRGKAYAKVDGNRRIVLFYEREHQVEFLFTDLTQDDNLLKIESL